MAPNHPWDGAASSRRNEQLPSEQKGARSSRAGPANEPPWATAKAPQTPAESGFAHREPRTTSRNGAAAAGPLRTREWAGDTEQSNCLTSQQSNCLVPHQRGLAPAASVKLVEGTGPAVPWRLHEPAEGSRYQEEEQQTAPR